MKFGFKLDLYRNRSVWTDPNRSWRTLEGFAATEEDGGRDLVAAASRVADFELREHLLRHADDELRHARLFRERAAEIQADCGSASSSSEAPDKPYDLSRGRKGVEMDAHGFFNAGLFDELGEVDYVAMLHVAEERAAYLMEVHRELNKEDERTAAMYDEILKDEKYHIAYTGRFLERWREDGRGGEVDAAMKAARSSRFLGAWKRLGLRSAAGFGRVLLYVFYWTLCLPFGLGASRSSQRGGWREVGALNGNDAKAGKSGADPLGQY